MPALGEVEGLGAHVQRDKQLRSAQGSCPLPVSVVILSRRISREKWWFGMSLLSEVLRQPIERVSMTLKLWNDAKGTLSSFLTSTKLGMSSTRFAETCEYWRYSAFIGIFRSSLKCKRSFAKH